MKRAAQARADELMDEVRVLLAKAFMCGGYADHMPNGTQEQQSARRRERDIGHAYVAVAANKMARVVHINEGNPS